jgi:hypothetical protein
LFVDASGNVQIGSSFAGLANGSGLEIERSTTSALRLTGASGVGCEFFNTGSLASIQTRSTIPFTIQTNELERLRITSAGLVGIGNSNPGAKLDVSGDAIFNGGGTQFPIQFANAFTPNVQRADIFFSANATSNNALRVGTIASNGGVTLQGTRQSDSSLKVNLVLNPDGGVGIGATKRRSLNAAALSNADG